MTIDNHALDTLAAEIKGLALAQQTSISELMALHCKLEALPGPLANAAQGAATQQAERTAELVCQIKSDIGQVLAALAAHQPMPHTVPRVRLGWLSIASLVGAGSSAAMGGPLLATLLGLGHPLHGEAARMATYVWLVQGRTLEACLRQVQATGQGVQCPLAFRPQQ